MMEGEERRSSAAVLCAHARALDLRRRRRLRGHSQSRGFCHSLGFSAVPGLLMTVMRSPVPPGLAPTPSPPRRLPRQVLLFWLVTPSTVFPVAGEAHGPRVTDFHRCERWQSGPGPVGGEDGPAGSAGHCGTHTRTSSYAVQSEQPFSLLRTTGSARSPCTRQPGLRRRLSSRPQRRLCLQRPRPGDERERAAMSPRRSVRLRLHAGAMATARPVRA
ncbi:hypothetical protein AAFF_G00240070 [Aldrovandia affinis]|uniref:Uncharacterized protein n=1 Tax=Aldrovandia affinis TaxID=143900 RepID=A0AAD7WTK9_9TELE|nr:hypothetical protein AAFF_G00240070 [Aldrovandia affinis]